MLKTLTQHFLSSAYERPSNTPPSHSLPVIDWNYKTVDIETGERIRYSIIGNAPQTIVLIHGVFHSIKTLATVIPHLTKSFTVVCVELRGHGESSYNSPLLTMDDITTDIHCVLKTLNIKKFSMYGVSLGGMICLRYAALYPEQVENLIMLGPLALGGNLYRQKDKQLAKNRHELRESDFMKFMYNLQKTRDLEQSCKGLLPVCFSERVPPRDILENLASSNFDCRCFADILWVSQQYNFTNEKVMDLEPDHSVSKVQCKVLILCGEHDGYLPKSMLAHYNDYLKEKLTIKVFPKTGHLIAELEPEQVVQYINEFCLQENNYFERVRV